MSMILGSTGRPWVEFGGARAWRTYTKGDIVCSFQWVDVGDESGEPQPCMCLYPVVRKMDGHVYVIPQGNAFAYADSKGNPQPQLMGSAFKAAAMMGFHPDKSTVFRIMDVILECLPDLVKMPSSQPVDLNVKRRTLGVEVTAAINGRTLAEVLH